MDRNSVKKEIERIISGGYKEKALGPGDMIPDSDFLSSNKRAVTLSEQRKGRPAILSFNRGF